MPKLYLPLLRAQLVKLDSAFQPGLSIITWTSLEIGAYCDNIERVLDEVDLFVKEVCYFTHVNAINATTCKVLNLCGVLCFKSSVIISIISLLRL